MSLLRTESGLVTEKPAHLSKESEDKVIQKVKHFSKNIRTSSTLAARCNQSMDNWGCGSLAMWYDPNTERIPVQPNGKVMQRKDS